MDRDLLTNLSYSDESIWIEVRRYGYEYFCFIDSCIGRYWLYDADNYEDTRKQFFLVHKSPRLIRPDITAIAVV